MSLDDFEKSIQKVAPLAEQICLHLMGEPLAHPHFKKIISLCEKYKAKIQLTTNGILLKKYKEEILEANCLHQVNISLQAYMDNYPNKSLEAYLEEVYSFIDSAFNQKPELYLNLRLWNIEKNSHDINEPIFKFIEDKLNIEINRNIELANIKSKRLRNRLYLHFDSRFEWPRLELPFKSDSGRCNGLIDHFAIHADGSVVPCCLDDQKIIRLGNILEENVEEILSSERALRIENGFRNNQLKEDLCQRCSFISRFRK